MSMFRVYKQVADRLSSLGGSYVGDPPDAAQVPYVFVWGPAAVKASSLMAANRGETSFTMHATVVAHSPANTLALAAQAEELLAGFTPTIEGWRVFPLDVTGSEPVQTQRGSFEPTTNRYPAWVVLHIQVQAVKDSEETNG